MDHGASPFRCMDDDEFEGWAAANARTGRAYEVASPCADCTPEYRRAQRVLLLCDRRRPAELPLSLPASVRSLSPGRGGRISGLRP